MSAARAPLYDSVRESRVLRAAMPEASLIIHGPPDFHEAAEILGVCGVSAENAKQNRYSWMVADFLTWKMLLHQAGVRTHQVREKSLINIDSVECS